MIHKKLLINIYVTHVSFPPLSFSFFVIYDVVFSSFFGWVFFYVLCLTWHTLLNIQCLLLEWFFTKCLGKVKLLISSKIFIEIEDASTICAQIWKSLLNSWSTCIIKMGTWIGLSRKTLLSFSINWNCLKKGTKISFFFEKFISVNDESVKPLGLILARVLVSVWLHFSFYITHQA